MVDNLVEHMVKEFQSSIHARLTLAIEVYTHADIGLAGLARHLDTALRSAQILRHSPPIIGHKHATSLILLACKHLLTNRLGLHQDSLCAQVPRQFNIGQAVANDITFRQVVLTREVLAKHSRAGLACRCIILGKGAVDELVIKLHTLATQRCKHLVVGWVEDLLGE